MQDRLTATAAFAALGLLLDGCGNFAPGRAAATATGLVSHQLCSAVFVSGLDPHEFYRQAIEPMVSPAGLLFSHRIDRERAEVTATVAGLAQSRAVYRGRIPISHRSLKTVDDLVKAEGVGELSLRVTQCLANAKNKGFRRRKSGIP